MTGSRQQKPRIGLTKCPDLVDHYKPLWVDESAQHPATELSLLTEQELQLYRDLKQ